MRSFLVFLLILFPSLIFCQTVKVDSSYGYTLQIPAWLQIKETGKANIFSGTLPETEDGIVDTIQITAFPKSQFRSFGDFKETFLTGNKFGKPTGFSKEHVWYGQKELVKIPNGVEQRVFIHWNSNIYNEMFILLETKSRYLWIQYVATPGSYDVNIEKFEEFMLGLKLNGL